MSIREKFHIPELYASYENVKSLKIEAANLISWDLTPRQLCDLELLMNGGFYPLNGFLNKTDYDGVVENMRLANGSLWPIPINLDVTASFAKSLNNGQRIALRDQEGVIIAILEIADIYEPNKNKEVGFYRTAIGALFLFCAVKFRGGNITLFNENTRLYSLIGFLNASIPFTLLPYGLITLPSNIGVIILSANPFLALVLAHYFTLDEKLSIRKVIGSIIGFSGVVFAVGMEVLVSDLN